MAIVEDAGTVSAAITSPRKQSDGNARHFRWFVRPGMPCTIGAEIQRTHVLPITEVAASASVSGGRRLRCFFRTWVFSRKACHLIASTTTARTRQTTADG